MAKKINVGGNYVDVPSSLDPAAPQDLRGTGPRPNSFGDAASSAQVKTPPAGRVDTASMLQRPSAGDTGPAARPSPAAQAAMAAKPIDASTLLQKQSAGTIPTQPTGATNAAAGATQTAGTTSGPVLEKAAPLGSNPAGAAGGSGATNFQPVKGALRDFVKGPGLGTVLAVGSQGYVEKDNLGAGDPTKIAESAARIGGAGAGAGAGTMLGAKIGAGLGALTGPFAPAAVPVLGLAGSLAGGWAGSHFGPKITDAAIGAGRALTDGDSDRALAIATGQADPGLKATAQPASLRSAPQDPLRVQEARNNIADPGRADVPMPAAPASLRFGMPSPAGTFTNGFTDVGQGIARKGNEYTNLGADGKPTALSGMDTRTPDQIANAARINAETAKVVAAAGGSANLARQNAVMAANLRDGVDPMRGLDGRSQVSIMRNTSGTGGGRRNKFDDGSGLVTPVTGRGLRDEQRNALQAEQNAIARENNLQMSEDRRYSAESGERVKRLEIEQQQAQRDRIASYMGNPKGTPGERDFIAGMERATLNGDAAATKAFSDLIAGAQAAGKGTGDLNKQQSERLASKIIIPILDENGKQTDKRDAAAEASTMQALLSRRPELAQLSDAALNEVLPKLVAEHTLNQKLNTAKAGSSGLSFHGFTPSFNGHLPDSNTLPDLRGASAGQEGFFNGVNTGSGEWTLRGLNDGYGTHGLGHLNADEIAALRAATVKQK